MTKVSILTPCYNGADFISRWAAGIMSQDYPNLQVIVVNDGSTDNSGALLEALRPRFGGCHIEYIVLEQQNQGQAAAINEGLKHVTGEYLTLLDIDDVFLDNAIHMQANLLTSNPDVDIVQSSYFKVYSERGYKRKGENNAPFLTNPYENLIKRALTMWAGTYMLRHEALSCFYQGRDIYISPGGQNLQMTMPVLKRNNRLAYHNFPLLNYYIRPSSHSKGSYEEQQATHEAWKDIYIHMMTSLAESEQEIQRYTHIINKKAAQTQLELAYFNGNKADVKKFFAQLPKKDRSRRTRLMYLLSRQSLVKFDFLRRIKKRLRPARKILIDPKESCSGCHACAGACPKSCIEMTADNEGFLYPKVDQAKCDNCNICKEICPFKQKPLPNREIPKAYAAYATDEQARKQASSGGLFGYMAKQVIGRGGVVFGARFNDKHEVVHSFTQDVGGLGPLYGSKYVQSRIGDNFVRAKEFLESGREVLFCGTPCQIEGLCAFLGKDYENLCTVDFICHGVPSPKVWAGYVGQFGGDIGQISFRDKHSGWRAFSFSVTKGEGEVIYRKVGYGDLYLQGFISNYYLRPSCYNCQTKKIIRLSDVTLADFWGVWEIDPEIDDDKGMSLLMISTEKGESLMQAEGLWRKPADLFEAMKYNACAHTSKLRPPQRDTFFTDFDKMPVRKVMRKYCGPKKARRLAARVVRRLVGRN